MFKDFKAFVMRGNVMDLAVGVIIGAAFGKIVSSFVTDILMPPLGLTAWKSGFRKSIPQPHRAKVCQPG